MRRNENGDVFFARQLDQMPPEHIPGARINAGRRLVKDQHFGRMKTRGGELKTLFDPQRQRGRHYVSLILKREVLQGLFHERARPWSFDAIKPCMQRQILPNRQFLIERKGLRHIADFQPRLHVARGDRLPQELRRAAGHLKQPGQHFHCGCFSATVRAEETEYFPSIDMETHIVHGGEIAKAPR